MRTIYFDLETGGVKDEPVIQLAAVAVDQDLNELASFEQKIQFDPSLCDPKALEINGYTPEAWAKAISPAATVARFSSWVRPHSTVPMTSRAGQPYMVARLAGYNALTFDLPRLRAMYGQSFFPCSYHVRDVLQRAMFWFDEHPEAKPAGSIGGPEKPKSMKLSELCEYFGMDTAGAHEALTDVRMTVELYRRLM